MKNPDPSAEQQAAFEDWYIRNISDPQAYASMLDNYDRIMDQVDRRRHRGRNVRWICGSAAAVLLLPVLVALGIRYDRQNRTEQLSEVYVTGKSQQELVLSDGTHLHLSPGTRVTYPERFMGRNRKIFVDGEVFAIVSKDKKHPFVIESMGVDVTVLGTTFNFKSYSEDEGVELMLLNGSVAMSVHSGEGDKELLLHPGNIAVYSRSTGDLKLSDFSEQTLQSFSARTSIRYLDVSFSDVVRDLERRFGKRIVLTDSSLNEKRCYAIFSNNENLEEIITALNFDNSMYFKVNDGIYYIYLK